ncbi:MAG: NYN domain-containing protein [Acidimicrobiales bacterium]
MAGPDRSELRGALWIVDGNNVMGSRPDGWWRDRRGAAQRLAAQLRSRTWPEGTAVVIVFDGPGPDERGTGPGGAGGHEPVQVVYAGPGRSADDAIVDLVMTHSERSRTVFSSDRQLGRRCASAGAAVLGAGTLLRRLEGSGSD